MRFGGMPWIAGFAVYVLLCVAQSSIFGAWGALLVWLRKRLGWDLLWLAPITLVVVEWLYPAIFPSYLANTQYLFLPAIQSADIWGVLGVSFVIALSSSLIYRLGVAPRLGKPRLSKVQASMALGVIAFNFAYGLIQIPRWENKARDAKQLMVGMVQTNMGIFEKRNDPSEGLRRHREQTVEAQRRGAQLVIWPESGFNGVIDTADQQAGDGVLGDVPGPVLLGGLRREWNAEGEHLYNTAFLLDADRRVLGTYDKTFLLAFGETLPFGERYPVLYDWFPYTAHFTRGSHTRALVLGDTRISTMICYEDILPRFARKLAEDKPNLLVNITNDSWYGRTHEPVIHLALAVFRSVEQRRYLARSTNSGISAFVAPTGEIEEQTEIFEPATIVRSLALIDDVTPYVRFGDWFGWACLLVLIIGHVGAVREPTLITPKSQLDD